MKRESHMQNENFALSNNVSINTDCVLLRHVEIQFRIDPTTFPRDLLSHPSRNIQFICNEDSSFLGFYATSTGHFLHDFRLPPRLN